MGRGGDERRGSDLLYGTLGHRRHDRSPSIKDYEMLKILVELTLDNRGDDLHLGWIRASFGRAVGVGWLPAPEVRAWLAAQENAGLVDSDTDPDDKRARVYRLTPAAYRELGVDLPD